MNKDLDIKVVYVDIDYRDNFPLTFGKTYIVRGVDAYNMYVYDDNNTYKGYSKDKFILLSMYRDQIINEILE